MRDIRFRMWVNEKKHFVQQGGPVSLESVLILLEGKYGEINSDYYTLQQFTGLKDKNGRDIYEGDILCILENDPYITGGNALVSVEWQGAGWCYHDTQTNKIDSMWNYLGNDSTQDECAEIIGNIFENPELVSRAAK